MRGRGTPVSETREKVSLIVRSRNMVTGLVESFEGWDESLG